MYAHEVQHSELGIMVCTRDEHAEEETAEVCARDGEHAEEKTAEDEQRVLLLVCRRVSCTRRLLNSASHKVEYRSPLRFASNCS